MIKNIITLITMSLLMGYGMVAWSADEKTMSAAERQAMIQNLLKKAQTTAQQSAQQSAQTQQPVKTRTAPTQRLVKNTGLPEQAFASVVRSIMPMSPQQIKTLHYLYNQTQQAATQYPGVQPRATSTSMVVNMSPGATPPIVRLRQNYVTSLIFLDATGAPWPIAAIDWGNPQAFNIQWNKKSNSLLVQANQQYAQGNIAIMLKGMNTPVMLTFITGQAAVDYRVDVRVPRMGPNANPVINRLPAASNPQLINVLDGITPPGSQTLQVRGGNGQAWMLNGHLFLRTDLTLLSPAWTATMTSSDGTHAYELPAAPVLLASDRGKIIKLMIKGL